MDLYFIITNQMADKFGLPQDKDGNIGWTISKSSLFSEVIFASHDEAIEWVNKNLAPEVKGLNNFAICKISPSESDLVLIIKDLLGIGNASNVSVAELTLI